jgi:adenine-specific DNA-methyltransferase
MQKLEPNDPTTRSADIVARNVEELKTLFPEAFTEGKVDFEVLKQLLGGAIDEREEKYGLNWHGKRRARQLALTPSTGTLRPCPEDSVDWDTTQNLMIEGDNLEVLKLLQKSYAGKVKLIYIDPPYNTGNDLIYSDRYADALTAYLLYTKQVDERRLSLSTNSESSGRYHTNWINMMFPRLLMARALLRHDGVIFVSIDDHEVARLRCLLDEVFGEENFLATFVWRKMDSPSRNDERRIVSEYHDYIVAYTRSGEAKLQQMPKPEILKAYPLVLEDGRRARRRQLRKNGKAARRQDRPSMWYRLTAPDNSEVWPIAPPPDNWEGRWSLSEKTWKEREAAGQTEWIRRDYGWVPYCIEYAPDNPSIPWSTWWDDLSQNRQAKAAFTALMRGSELTFDNPKPIDLLRRMLAIGAGDDAIVMDFFAGSGSMGHAVFAQNAADGGRRRFILVQLPESQERNGPVCAVTIERLRRAAQSVIEETTAASEEDGESAGLEDKGFRVFKLDSSNIREWQPNREDLDQTLVDHQEHLRADRTEADVLYELLLKLGLDLCVPMQQKTIAGKVVQSIGGGVLLACLATEITRNEVEPLAQGIVDWHRRLAPAGDTTCVFRDSAFADDVAKTNLAAILSQHGLANVRSL